MGMTSSNSIHVIQKSCLKNTLLILLISIDISKAKNSNIIHFLPKLS